MTSPTVGAGESSSWVGLARAILVGPAHEAGPCSGEDLGGVRDGAGGRSAWAGRGTRVEGSQEGVERRGG